MPISPPTTWMPGAHRPTCQELEHVVSSKLLDVDDLPGPLTPRRVVAGGDGEPCVPYPHLGLPTPEHVLSAGDRYAHDQL